MNGEGEEPSQGWPPRWYRSRPEVLAYEQILTLVRQNAVLETKLDDARDSLKTLKQQVSSLELSRAADSVGLGLGKWVANALIALAAALIGAGGVWWGGRP